MNIKPIHNDADLQAAFTRLSSIYQAPAGTPEADEMEVLTTLIEVYENQRYPITPPDPVDAIRFFMNKNHAYSDKTIATSKILVGIVDFCYRYRHYP